MTSCMEYTNGRAEIQLFLLCLLIIYLFNHIKRTILLKGERRNHGHILINYASVITIKDETLAFLLPIKFLDKLYDEFMQNGFLKAKSDIASLLSTRERRALPDIAWHLDKEE